jgi:hypothetical protein
LWEYITLLFFLLNFFLLIVRLLSPLYLKRIAKADGLNGEFIGNSFFCAEGKALIHKYIDSDAGIQTDGES